MDFILFSYSCTILKISYGIVNDVPNKHGENDCLLKKQFVSCTLLSPLQRLFCVLFNIIKPTQMPKRFKIVISAPSLNRANLFFEYLLAAFKTRFKSAINY